MGTVTRIPGAFKVVPCECGSYDFYINTHLVAVCQACENEIVIKSSSLPTDKEEDEQQ